MGNKKGLETWEREGESKEGEGKKHTMMKPWIMRKGRRKVREESRRGTEHEKPNRGRMKGTKKKYKGRRDSKHNMQNTTHINALNAVPEDGRDGVDLKLRGRDEEAARGVRQSTVLVHASHQPRVSSFLSDRSVRGVFITKVSTENDRHLKK